MDDFVEVWKLSNIIQTDRERKFRSGALEEGALGNDYVKFPAHDEAVTDVSLAPDGNVMCTSSADGRVKFWPSLLARRIKQNRNMHFGYYSFLHTAACNILLLQQKMF